MPVTTRNITVTLYDFDGSPLESATVRIKLVGLGNSADGAISPGNKQGYTDPNGRVVFALWQNDFSYSDTYYELSSWHPTTGQSIHKREQFVVGDSDAAVENLINVAPTKIDPTQALADQVSQDRAAIEAIAESLSGVPVSTITVENQMIIAVTETPIEIVLGQAEDFNEDQIVYSADPADDIDITGNTAVFESASTGFQAITITATLSNASSATAVLSVTVFDSASIIEYQLPAVVVI